MTDRCTRVIATRALRIYYQELVGPVYILLLKHFKSKSKWLNNRVNGIYNCAIMKGAFSISDLEMALNWIPRSPRRIPQSIPKTKLAFQLVGQTNGSNFEFTPRQGLDAQDAHLISQQLKHFSWNEHLGINSRKSNYALYPRVKSLTIVKRTTCEFVTHLKSRIK